MTRWSSSSTSPASPTGLNGNHIIGNYLSANGLGDPAAGIPQGDPGAPVNKTTNIDIVSDPGATPINGTVIADNHIANTRVGIWLVTSGKTIRDDNTFTNVKVHVRVS